MFDGLLLVQNITRTNRRIKKSTPVWNGLFDGECSQRDSNSRFSLERAASWSPRRWGQLSDGILPFHHGRVKHSLRPIFDLKQTPISRRKILEHFKSASGIGLECHPLIGGLRSSKKDTPQYSECLCGRYWTRTNDLCDVNATL